jgi:hypothetical protein
LFCAANPILFSRSDRSCIVVIGLHSPHPESLRPLRIGRADGGASQPVTHLHSEKMFSELTSKFLLFTSPDAPLQSVDKERTIPDGITPKREMELVLTKNATPEESHRQG